MKKNLLALAALAGSVALLAGCGTATPEEVIDDTTTPVVEETPAPVVEETTTPATGTTTPAPVAPTAE